MIKFKVFFLTMFLIMYSLLINAQTITLNKKSRNELISIGQTIKVKFKNRDSVRFEKTKGYLNSVNSDSIEINGDPISKSSIKWIKVYRESSKATSNQTSFDPLKIERPEIILTGLSVLGIALIVGGQNLNNDNATYDSFIGSVFEYSGIAILSLTTIGWAYYLITSESISKKYKIDRWNIK